MALTDYSIDTSDPGAQGWRPATPDSSWRKRALVDALIRQGNGTFGSGAIGGFMPIGTIETAGSKPIIAPPLATGVPQSMVRAGMPQPGRPLVGA